MGGRSTYREQICCDLESSGQFMNRTNDTMTREQFVEKATNLGYSEEDIKDIIKVFRDEEEALGVPPIPYDQIPLFYQLY